ncbi:MAG: cytochrome P450, partial [Solirubrobacterales bacterium]|nr:cytochrome P450 [Solirubrobacterales bacterium]
MSGPARFSLRSGLAFRRDPLAFLRSIDGGGDLIRFRAGQSEFTLIKSPETIHRILVTDADRFGEGKWTLRGERVMGDCLITREGDPHRARRALLQPGFDRGRLDRKATALVERAERIEKRWRDGAEIEAGAEMSRLALEIAGEAIFSLDLEDHAETLVPALGTMLHQIPRPGLPWPAGRRLAAARNAGDGVVLDAVASRRASSNGQDDVLSLLLADRGNGGGPLSDRDLADEIGSLLIPRARFRPDTRLDRGGQDVGYHGGRNGRKQEGRPGRRSASRRRARGALV